MAFDPHSLNLPDGFRIDFDPYRATVKLSYNNFCQEVDSYTWEEATRNRAMLDKVIGQFMEAQRDYSNKNRNKLVDYMMAPPSKDIATSDSILATPKPAPKPLNKKLLLKYRRDL